MECKARKTLEAAARARGWLVRRRDFASGTERWERIWRRSSGGRERRDISSCAFVFFFFSLLSFWVEAGMGFMALHLG